MEVETSASRNPVSMRVATVPPATVPISHGDFARARPFTSRAVVFDRRCTKAE